MKLYLNPQRVSGLMAFTFSCLTCISCTSNSNAYADNVVSATTYPSAVAQHVLPVTPPGSKKKIKIALLLDTSNSMDGLIEQAKSQLWKLVNQLSAAKCENESPDLEIALYEYGNDRLSSSEGYVRQVSMFTNDLDHISEQLFSLTTNGGSEFCGYVINTSLNQLNWQGDDGDLNIIFIAGNEPFTQGPVSAVTSCKKAKESNVIINTIYCGNFEEGLGTGWRSGAILANGEYMSIEQNRKTIYIESPYDAEIAKLNDKINTTYISYGKTGHLKKQNQSKQDANASSYGSSNTTERTISKTSSFYSNKTWDIVDASEEKEFDIGKIKEEELPEELKGKTKEQKEKYITVKKQEREIIKNKIIELNKQRIKYVAEKQKSHGDDKTLDAAMLKAIKEQASKKKFVFES
jgi:hypothetical protein